MRPSLKLINIFNLLVILGWFIILFLVSINFLYKINEVIIALALYTIGLMVVFRHKPTLNLEMLILLLFGTAYFFIYVMYMPYSPRSYITFWVGAGSMYFIGKSFISKKTIKFYPYVLFTIAFGLYTYGFLNMVVYLIEGTADLDARWVYEFWEGHQLVATLQGIYFNVVGGLLVYNLMHWNKIKHIPIKILHFGVIGISVYFSILLENRTYFFLMAIVFVLMVLLELFLSKLKFYIPLIISATFVFMVYYGYMYDVLGVKTFVEATDWYQRFTVMLEAGLLNDPRFPVYGLVRAQFLDYPLGGFQMDLGGLDYAHNLWLDTLYAVGIYPFILLAIYTLLTLITMARVIFTKYIKKHIKILIASIYVSLFINFMTEPILEGVPYVFLLFCLINGLTYQYLITMRALKPLSEVV